MFQNALAGMAAGSLGTVALNTATYTDMAIRGRQSSNAPAQLVAKVADKTGLDLSAKGKGSQDKDAQNRESGIGALLGYVNGLGTGALYGLLRSQMEDVPLPLAIIGVGAVAMMASDGPLVALRISNPKTWGVSGWAADVIPHLIYGLVTVLAYENFAE